MEARRPRRRYGVAIVAVLAATVVRMLLDPWLGESHYFTLYYAAVALVTWYSGPFPAVLTLIAGLILGDWFFEEPRHALGPVTVRHWVSSITFVITSGVIVVFSRLSHLAYQAERLRAAEAHNRQLAEADEHKNRFLATLGHELRNPLSGIVASVQTIKMIGLERDDAEEMLAILERQSGLIQHLVDDLLDISRISCGKIQLQQQRCELRELVRGTVAGFVALPESRHVQTALSLPDQPLWTDGDPTRLGQILINLLVNAAKFTDAGGRISVALTEEREEGWASISVTDTGIGIPAEMLSGIFEPFRQLDHGLVRSRSGLGLGLALVKGLVELHGGRISAASAGPGRGSQFRVHLPLVSEGCIEPAAPPRAPRWAGSFRVLLIDDRRDVIVPLRKMLELDGQTVAVASDGEMGLQIARQFRPDIVLCDIGLPGMDGYALVERIRADANLRAAYVVALTGYGREEDRRRAMEAGFDYHVTKPVGKRQLDALLAERPRFEPADANLRF